MDVKELAKTICGITIGADYARVRPGIVPAVESLLANIWDDPPPWFIRSEDSEKLVAEAYERAAQVAEQNDGRTPGSCCEAEAMNIASHIRKLGKGGE